MNNFTYYTPTKMVFEKDAENLAGKMLKEFGYKKILLHYGSGSVIRSGLLDRVKKSLEESEIEYFELGGVVPNPVLSKVYEGIEIGKKNKIDAILAVGGGSVIDSSKAIGMGLAYGGDVWDLFIGKAESVGCTPIATVLTIAAAGSEMSDSCVVTKEEGGLKRVGAHPDSMCKFALMNPALMLTLPDYQTACGCVDILIHTMERYFNTGTNMEVTDVIAQSIMKTTMATAKKLKANPQDLEARWNIMWTGSLSHNSLTGCGINVSDWATHNIEHEVGGMFGVAHGAGLAALWATWARYVLDAIPERFEQYAMTVLDIPKMATPTETGLAGIKATEEFFKSLDMPISLAELGVTPSNEQIEEMADKATNGDTKTQGFVKQLNKSDIIKILTNAR